MRWRYGNYEFHINPDRQSDNITLVGDNVRTLNGTYIAQPTGVVEKLNFESVFYQGRTKIIDEKSLLHADKFCYGADRLYVLNKNQYVIYVYNQNLVQIDEMAIPGEAGQEYISIAVDSRSIWLLGLTQNGTYFINNLNIHDATLIHEYELSHLLIEPIGMTCIEDSIVYITDDDGAIEGYHLTGGNDYKVTSFIIPNFPHHVVGLTSYSEFLVIGCKQDQQTVIYHVDIHTHEIVNTIMIEDESGIDDICMDGDHFVTYNKNIKRLTFIRGNTTLLDKYLLEREIESKRNVKLIDDMGVERKVVVESYDATRLMGHEHMYIISMSVQNTDGG
ncbi:hypothetical protein [Chengkuizengella axinellae]|uniref:Cell surface protein n=1 Tax=Chengkuizengella axinellae TaxID=3064388 RepID=A0ABT9IWP0_9BACL|nr:hypothetical protein [Chengkuizengella sp. 2205SS18-9]MDP5273673.1 hypothetical protein [Chengkuizengella sp. 2205SS18-9]